MFRVEGLLRNIIIIRGGWRDRSILPVVIAAEGGKCSFFFGAPLEQHLLLADHRLLMKKGRVSCTRTFLPAWEPPASSTHLWKGEVGAGFKSGAEWPRFDVTFS